MRPQRTILATENTELTEKTIKIANNKDIVNGNCWLAYFDILGFKDKVEELKDYLDIFVRNYYQQTLDAANKSNYYPENVFRVHFSDSFLFFTRNDTDTSCNEIIQVAEHFVWNCIDGIGGKPKPLRGGLTVGKFYADITKSVFVGLALIKAIEYEQKQEWIGLVLTPEARNRLKGMSLGYISNFKEYDVPTKHKTSENGITVIRCKSEKLYAHNLWATTDLNKTITRNIQQMKKEAKKGQDKYDKTLEFINYLREK